MVFQFQDLNVNELEKATLCINVSDSRLLRSNVLIGNLELDLSFIYFQKYHEIYHRWVALANFKDSRKPGIRGYFKLSVVLLGPGDEQYMRPAHAEDDDDFAPVIMPPNVSHSGTNLKVNVWQVEDLAVMDSAAMGGAADPFVKVEFGGNSEQTTHLTNIRSGNFDKQLALRVVEPVMAHRVAISVWDYDVAEKDDLIGTVSLDYQIAKAGALLAPRWYSFYGALTFLKSHVAERMNQGLLDGSFLFVALL